MEDSEPEPEEVIVERREIVHVQIEMRRAAASSSSSAAAAAAAIVVLLRRRSCEDRSHDPLRSQRETPPLKFPNLEPIPHPRFAESRSRTRIYGGIARIRGIRNPRNWGEVECFR